MAKVGFANNDFILNGLREGILNQLKLRGRVASWEFASAFSTGSGRKEVKIWESTFSYGSISHKVIFKETIEGKLGIYVDGSLIGVVREGMGSSDFRPRILIEALGVIK